MKKCRGKKVIFRIMMIYTLVVGSWVIVSDYLLAVTIKDPILAAKIEMVKGLLTVLATSGLLHFTLSYYYGKLQKSEEALRESDASPSHESVLGVKVDDYEGTSVMEFVHPEDVPLAKIKMQKLIETGMQQEIQVRIRYADGRYGVFEVKGMPAFDNAGQVEKIVVIASDLTERMKAEEMLRKSEKLSVVGQLAAGVAHEIRNPLTALKGFVQLLQANNDKFQNYYEVMMSELDRINTIVSEFLFLAKPQAAQFERKDIRVLINNILALLETHAIMSNVRIVTDFAADLPAVNCEENQLKQVFINVLKNAIEAMPDGGEVSIKVRMQDSNTVSIRFEDNGMGIPQDRIPQLGEPFYTTKEKGTGLGLMVSFKIIEAHKGNITISSQINQGTVVEIALPA